MSPITSSGSQPSTGTPCTIRGTSAVTTTRPLYRPTPTAARAITSPKFKIPPTPALAGTTIDSHGHRTTVPRFHFALENVTQLHADIGWFIGALAVAVVIGLRFSSAPRQAVRFGWLVLIGLGVQGVIGYTQYFNHLPAGLVWVHVSTSVLLWIFVLRLYLSTGPGRLRSLLRPGAVAAVADTTGAGAGGAAPAAPPPAIKTTIL